MSILSSLFHLFLYLNKKQNISCVNHFQIRNFPQSVFSRIEVKYGNILFKSPYLVQVRENMVQKNSVLRHFSCSIYRKLTDSLTSRENCKHECLYLIRLGKPQNENSALSSYLTSDSG